MNLRATLDDLDVLVAASKPATKDLAPFLARAAPARATTRARRSPTCARSMHRAGRRQRPHRPAATRRRALEQAAKPAFAQLDRRRCSKATPVLKFIRPVHARPRRLAARLRPGRGELRRQRPLRAHPADLQRLLVHRQPGRRHAHADPAEPAPRRPADRQRHAAARAPPRQPPPDGSAPWRDTDGTLDCDPSLVLARPMRRVLAIAAVLVAAARAGRLRHGRGRRRRRLQACARSSRTRSRSSRARTSRSPASRSARSSRSTSRPTRRPRSSCASTAPASTTSARDAECTIRPQSLIGEKFVECTPTQPRAGGRASRRRRCARSSAGDGKGQYLLPVDADVASRSTSTCVNNITAPALPRSA